MDAKLGSAAMYEHVACAYWSTCLANLEIDGKRNFERCPVVNAESISPILLSQCPPEVSYRYYITPAQTALRYPAASRPYIREL